ncbi:MAG: response regulator transcription factor [Flavobacteriaceae bacterium]|nr:response regulator transcription factor [Flavobacteriaceae bacterium]
MKALIIEDEIPSARRLERLLLQFEVEIVAKLSSVKQSVKWLKENEQPDILFLDIHLSDGLCFLIFEQVEVHSRIIFTTAYSDYSIKAFQYNSLSYLLKPIKEMELKNAMEKAVAYTQKEALFKQLKSLITNDITTKYKRTFTVKNGTKIKIIKEEEIVCFYSFDNATFIRTADFTGIINYSLSILETEINPNLFFRVNRSFIVQKNTIKEIVSYPNSRLQLQLNGYNEREIIVSRERVKEFREWI